MEEVNDDFKQRVYTLVSQIPKGRVMTYGQLAALAGSPYAARIVGGIAHWATCYELPTCPANPIRWSGLDEVQGKGEQRSETYMKYVEGAAESLTKQFAKSKSGAGGSAHRQAVAACPAHDLPWQRVVKKDGSLAEGYPGGTEGHRAALQAEGVEFDEEYKLDINKLLWQPPIPGSNSLL